MPGEILKTIKIDVNSSEYKALLRSCKQLEKIEKDIAKVKKSYTGEFLKRRL